jgi:hypothetical protein
VNRTVRADLLAGRTVRDSAGRRVGRIRELVAEVVEPGSGQYVVREIHVSTGGVIERLAGAHLTRILIDRMGLRSNRLVLAWRDVDLSDPEHPRLR